MLISSEDRVQPLVLLIGEQISPGPQRPAGAVERVTRPAPVPEGVLLYSLSASIQRLCCQGDHVERVHDRGGLGELFSGGGLEPGEPVHGHHADVLSEVCGLGVKPALEDLLGTAFDHVQQPSWAGAIANRGQVNNHRDEAVAPAGVAPAVLIDPEDFDAVEAGGVVDQQLLACFVWPTPKNSLITASDPPLEP